MIVPALVAESPRIVCWVYESRDGRRTKVPVQARNPAQRAAVDRPRTWARWSDAMAVYARGLVDGPGIVLGEGLVGVDLDHCREPRTGRMTPESVAIVRALDSYTEASPSGTGVHILVRGSLPPGGRRKGPVEMYSDGRFFTLTGRRLVGTPEEICERTEALAAVHRQVFGERTTMRLVPGVGPTRTVPASDVRLIGLARAAKNGAKFAALYAGDASAYGSRSEADMALCNILAWWTRGDALRVDSLFRASGLMRPKWDAAAGEQTYGQRTVARACAEVRR